ncbi:proto-oncogene tyrosine-protein kinase ROS-like [Lytechinus variegatus]|uniref:proto-oncogene tyrosine-protein kinase ROS-like n=1 Tax=Lytechinus variegatus TaxID=7654 RepID=UPI001BB277F8|nr:proto-oncogene tyrosine-protein kinase ROS-like [Lytechinus variegatus]
MAKLWKTHQFHICFFTFGMILFAITNGNLVLECNERCSSLSTSILSDTGQCDTECRNSSCSTGCSSWDNSTLAQCYAVCNQTYSSEPFRVQYCQSGCLFAENEYAEEVIGVIGQPSSPLPSNIGTTSLTLSWTAASHQDVTYLVEWRYTEGGGRAWNYYGSGEPMSETTLDITDLIPYAEYQFRIIWVITPRHTLTSPTSSSVRTLPSGVPSTAPTITSIVSSSPTTISLTWDPPAFPNGPIIGYVIGVQSFLNEAGIVKEVDGSTTETTVIDPSLRASTLYAVSVRARNMEGAGMSDTVNVTTGAEPENPGIVPYIVIGVTSLSFTALSEISSVSLVEYGKLRDVDPVPSDIHTVDNENSTISDVAVDYWKNFIFISDSDGQIHRRTIDPGNLTLATSEVLYTNQNATPTKLDVDWLNDQLYFVQGTEILRCNLNVSDCSTAVANIGSVPTEMKVDPFSGYLFWSERNVGIRRAPLTSYTINSGDADLIISLLDSSAFTVLSESFQILYTNSTGNSMHSSSLDGTNQQVMHVADAGSDHQFINVTSLVYFNRSLTWTFAKESGSVASCFVVPNYEYRDDERLFFEENTGTFTQADLFLCVDGYHGLDIFYPTYQPIPIPAFPPTDLQVLFTEGTADITWTRPLSIPGKGEAAWEEWLYEIILTNPQIGNTMTLTGLQEDSALIENLNASTEYSVQVRAYSIAGPGPLSETFSGSTLIEVDVEPYLLLANASDVWWSRLDGNGESWLLSPTANIKDIDWYQGYYIWSSVMGDLYRSAEGAVTDDQLTFDPSGVSSSVDAIAVDWLSEFLYWSDPDLNQILRGRLSNQSSTVTSQTTINAFASDVQDLAIDSVQAYIYWTTRSSVEGSRLNGESTLVFYEISELLLDVVAGLTLDLDGGYVYWFVVSRQNSVEELKLFRAQLAGISPDPMSTTEEIGEVLSETTSLALHFYSSKLFWINSQSRVEVSDDRGQRPALLPATDVQALTVVQETLKPLPEGHSERPTVVAQEIPSSSIQVTGTWDDFNITWQASTEVTYGIVFYTIAVVAPERTYEETVQSPFYNVRDLTPFQSLGITISPYTYWATTPQTASQLMSPMSVPSVPLNPRAFALESTDIMAGTTVYSAEFRWSQPAEINGVFEGYSVSWGTDAEQLTMFNVSQDVTEYTFSNLTANTTYFFQVEGFTSIGSGPATDPVNITTGVSPPPPTIVVNKGNAGVTLIDTDTSEEISLLGGTAVTVIAFVASEEKVFFVESAGDREIYSSNLDGTERVELLELGNQVPYQAGFVVDWISQILYWSDNTAIYSYDATLPAAMATTEMLYTAPEGNTIQGISVNPFGSTLIWTETTQTTSVLMTSDLYEWAPTPLFGTTNSQRRKRATENCTCSESLTPGSAVYIDSSDPETPTLFFVDATSNDLWTFDLVGCQCERLFEAASQAQSGLPPDTLSVDTSRVYWSNTAEEIVASVDKQTGADFQAQTGQNDVNFVLTYGTSLQPYPAPECLSPSDYTDSTQLSDAGSDRLTVTFDPVTECEGVSTATAIYTVSYAIVDSETSDLNCSTTNLTCNTMETTLNQATLDDLEPYTFYVTQVSVRNFYSMGSPVLGPVAIHRTTPGVPSAALMVAVSVLTPSEVNVVWSQPLEINGPLNDLRFRVKYSTDTQDFRTGYVDGPDGEDGRYSMMITDGLAAATEYTFTVESYQSSLPSNMFSSSETETQTTYQEPAMVEEISKTSTTLAVSWMSPDDDSVMYHWIQFKETSSSEWQDALMGNTTSGVRYNVTIGEGETDPLLPFTDYEVRTRILYRSGQEYEYPRNAEFLSSRTESDSPSAPGVPMVTETGTDPVTYEVRWTEPNRANGPGTLQYTLEARAMSTAEWSQVYEGSDTNWIIVDLLVGESYSFRVKARNDDYEGPYSPTSDAAFLPNPSSDNTVFIIIGAVVGVLVIVAIIIIVLVCRHQRTGGSKWPHFQEDVELAQLRNYPNMAIRQENSNYAVTHDGKEVLLPIFQRERLKLITFLGSGAFGEVFEGSALDILGSNSGETRVAVKTLRKGATDEEKQEFLKEATVMGKFKHPNIVSLMGVCLDNDPQYIILELMEGGDLLSYIRAARAPPPANSKITLLDQIEMIMDIVKGCEHLEELHFVHRDLAARNCLVSTKSYDAHMRVVKIGDFGLARDIYKNDYYRKEGEGLLPVRWMSPEGLMDGYFSIQSDVWAFGVLMWEVMSRGQQPYPARSNVEVLRFVEAGGRLSQPDQCPDEIYMMMRRCWERSTDDRPSFKMLKEMIHDFRRKSVGPNGADNFGFEGDGKVNYSHLKKDIPPEMEDYLLPIDSKGDIIKKPDIELPPDIDYDLADKDLANLDFEEDQKKEKRKGSKKGRSPFSSLRGRLPGGASAADTTPRLEAALQDLAHNRERGRDIDDERYLKYPVGSVSKATGADMANAADGAVGGATSMAADDGSAEGAVGYSADIPMNGDALNRTELSNYSQPRKRHPNPFRANSMEELDGYDNLAFATSGGVKSPGGAKASGVSLTGDIIATDYANV